MSRETVQQRHQEILRGLDLDSYCMACEGLSGVISRSLGRQTVEMFLIRSSDGCPSMIDYRGP